MSIPYPYELDDAGCLSEVLNQTAGADKGNRVSDGECEASEPTDPDPTDPDPTDPDPTDPDPTDPDPTDPPAGTNLSLGAGAGVGADGSGKAGGTSYGNVIDGDTNTYWSPSGSTGRISVKWGSDTTVSTIAIREAAGAEGDIGSWRVVDHDTGAVLSTGSGAGVITFTPTTLRKINFEITDSNGTPRVAEFETYAARRRTTEVDPRLRAIGPPWPGTVTMVFPSRVRPAPAPRGGGRSWVVGRQRLDDFPEPGGQHITHRRCSCQGQSYLAELLR